MKKIFCSSEPNSVIFPVSTTNDIEELLLKHKISNAFVTHILPVSAKEIIVTIMDGKITCLKF